MGMTFTYAASTYDITDISNIEAALCKHKTMIGSSRHLCPKSNSYIVFYQVHIYRFDP